MFISLSPKSVAALVYGMMVNGQGVCPLLMFYHSYIITLLHVAQDDS